MKRTLLFAGIAISIALSVSSCHDPEPLTSSVGFEDLSLEPDSFWNGSDLSGGFSSGNLFFPNHYVTPGDYWSGFVYSTMTDVTTASWTNQYSCIAGSGAGGSATYALLYSFSSDTLYFNIPEKVTSISFCNSAWAYLVMKNGDPVFGIEKMGGEDGTRPDYLRLILKAIDEQGNTVGTGEIYLADFDSTRVDNGFIGNLWTAVDLSQWGYIHRLVFSFETNVANEYGPLIPTYVCIDEIEGELETTIGD
ncbi:MAG: DUF4465 domain-containing protein [Bacteroidota bacterium]